MRSLVAFVTPITLAAAAARAAAFAFTLCPHITGYRPSCPHLTAKSRCHSLPA
jgi:hypothetical protein